MTELEQLMLTYIANREYAPVDKIVDGERVCEYCGKPFYYNKGAHRHCWLQFFHDCLANRKTIKAGLGSWRRRG
jgi:hypothetical protein